MWKFLNFRLLASGRVRWIIYPVLLASLWFWKAPLLLHAGAHNGFDLSGALVPVAQIEAGGPMRDGIPALDHPHFVDASQADFLHDVDRVLGVNLNGVQKAYPVRILNYHEIVNDRIGDTAVVVSFCPLCGTGMAFLAGRNGADFDFGVSGLLYDSDVLLYDRQTESLWSQLRKQAITGPLKGERLQQIALEHTSWSDWNSRYPETRVLSLDTGYERDYARSPYAEYTHSQSLMFDVSHLDRRFHPKEQVLGIEINGVARAYPFSILSRGPAQIQDQLGGTTIRIVFDVAHRSARAYAADKLIPSTIVFWFAWASFHPDTEVYQPAVDR